MSQAPTLSDLIKELHLDSIVPVKLESERLGAPDPANQEFQISWNLAFPDGDPLQQIEGQWTFRPRLIFESAQNGITIFRQTTIFSIQFGLKDPLKIEELWQDIKLQQIFRDKQILKTLWPVFRQQVITGMSSVGLTYLTLPWIV